MAYQVTLIPGDGVGPELAEATQAVHRRHRRRDRLGRPGGRRRRDGAARHAGARQRASSRCRRTKVALKAPITTPVGTGFRSVNVYLRQALDLYACVRPCKQYPGVRTFFADTKVDIVIVRENTEDLYSAASSRRASPRRPS